MHLAVMDKVFVLKEVLAFVFVTEKTVKYVLQKCPKHHSANKRDKHEK